MIDLKPADLDTVLRILAEHVPTCEVRAFGSRATWNAKDYSDLDLVVIGEEPVPSLTMGRLREAFEDSDLPICVDVLDWHTISDTWKEQINDTSEIVQEGRPIGEREDATLERLVSDDGRGACLAKLREVFTSQSTC